MTIEAETPVPRTISPARALGSSDRVSDIYRAPGYACPTCVNAALREFHGRLVCDECGGMLIRVADLVASVRELDGSSDALELVDDQPATVGCPRCRLPMRASELRLGTLALAGRFSRCDRDGVWFPRDAMTALFAEVSRRGGFRGLGAVGAGVGDLDRGSASSGAAAIANMPSGHGGMSGAMASIHDAFAGGRPASDRLAISHWQRRRPRVHTRYASAHQDAKLACPSCKGAPLDHRGDRWGCATCAGSFVENAALVAMVEEMAQAPWQVPPAAGLAGERTCPICGAAMLVETLEAVTVDRCATHGVWFDASELEAALHHASAEPVGLVAWLQRLFRRPDA